MMKEHGGYKYLPNHSNSISANYCTLKCMLMNCLHIKKITEDKLFSTKKYPNIRKGQSQKEQP